MISGRSRAPALRYCHAARTVAGIVAGSGEATATIDGTPARNSSGVAIAEPPLPSKPDRNPTPRPIAATTSNDTSTMMGPVNASSLCISSGSAIVTVYGSSAARVRRRRRRPRRVHQRRGRPAPVATVAVARRAPTRGRTRRRAVPTTRPHGAPDRGRRAGGRRRPPRAARGGRGRGRGGLGVGARRRNARGGHPADARRRPGRAARRRLPPQPSRRGGAHRGGRPRRRGRGVAARRTGRARLHRGHHRRSRPGKASSCSGTRSWRWRRPAPISATTR